jgi:hypothetical protein
VDDLLNDHRAQLQKLLDLYLDGNFPKEILVERRQRLQDTIDSLATERVNLAGMLESTAYSPEQLYAIKEYTKNIAAGLDEAEEDFDSRKHIVEMLNVYAALVIENEEKVAYVTCVFQITPERLLIVSPNTYRQKKLKNHNPIFDIDRTVRSILHGIDVNHRASFVRHLDDLTDGVDRPQSIRSIANS